MGLRMKIKLKGSVELNQKALEVPHGEDVSEIVAGMFEAMRKGKGVGLAANQVGILKRIIVVNTPGFCSAVINPVITKYSGKLKTSVEGCVSFPGKRVNKRRDNSIVIEGFDANWQPIKKKVKALSAFCIQHEVDHLDGITILNNG